MHLEPIPTTFELQAGIWLTIPTGGTQQSCTKFMITVALIKKRQQNTHVEQYHLSDNYTYHQPPRMVRQRMDEAQSYGGNGPAMWPTQQRDDSSNMLYGALAIAPMFSEEQTGSYIVSLCAFKKGSSPCQHYQLNVQYTPKVRFPLLVRWYGVLFDIKLAIPLPYEEHPGNVSSQCDFFLHLFNLILNVW